MCTTDDPADVTPVETLPSAAEWKGEVLPLEPVDELSVLTVCDNTADMLLPDQGPATRMTLARMRKDSPDLEAPALVEGTVPDVPLAQQGFSALVEVRKDGRVHQLLFDTGVTPDGCADNLRRLGRDPAGIEAIVCSHGHFDHTTGLSGLFGRLGRSNLPVLIHPEFWNRRRLDGRSLSAASALLPRCCLSGLGRRSLTIALGNYQLPRAPLERVDFRPDIVYDFADPLAVSGQIVDQRR